LRPRVAAIALFAAFGVVALVLLASFPSLRTPILAAPARISLTASLYRDGCGFRFRRNQYPEPTGSYSLVVRPGTVSPATANLMVDMSSLRRVNMDSETLSPAAEEALRRGFTLHWPGRDLVAVRRQD
jgi:hypothetical protein